MGAFQSGFQMGQGAYQQAIENQRNAENDKRVAEAFDWQRQERARQVATQGREDDAFAGLQNTQAGLTTGTQQQIKDTYGMTPQQTAAGLQVGGAAGLRARLASYDTPDSSDLQNVSAGTAPRMTAAGLNTAAPSRLDMEQAMGNVALARRDMVGLRASNDAQTGLRKQADTRDFMAHFNDIRARSQAGDADAAKELQTMLGPVMKIYSDHPDVPSSFYFDPKVHGVVQTPYGAVGKDGKPVLGTPRVVPDAEMMPALLAYRDLASEYADPAEAAERIAKMSAADRERVIASKKMEFEQATGLNKADTDQRHARSSEISANAAATSAGSIAAMRKEQIKDLDDQRTRRTGLEQIQSDVDALDPKDPQFAQKMRQLQARANLANVKNGAPLNFGRENAAGGAGRKSILQMPVDQKVNPDGSYTAFAKDGGGPLYNTWHGETMPLGMEVDDLKKLKGDAAKARVQMQLGENNGRLEYRFIGADGNPYATVDEAGRAKPGAKSASTVGGARGFNLPPAAPSRLPEITTAHGGRGYSYAGNNYSTMAQAQQARETALSEIRDSARRTASNDQTRIMLGRGVVQ